MPSRAGNKRNSRAGKGRRSATLSVRARSAAKRGGLADRARRALLGGVAAVLLICLLLVGGGELIRYFLISNDLYIVREIVVTSDGRLSPELVKKYGGVEEGGNIFEIDLDKVRRELENVPLIKSVEIRRALPDRIEISVSERNAIAIVETGSRGYKMMVDREGVLLGPAGQNRLLPTLTGLRMAELRVGRMLTGNLAADALEVLDLCDRTRLKQFIQIENIDMSDVETLELRLRSGEYVLLPRRQSREKLVDLANILNTCRRQGRKLAKIDMTVEGVAPAIEYRD